MLDHLPERDRPPVKRRLRHAWADPDPERALDKLRALADELDRSHPGAAASLREGMEETLTLSRLGIRGSLKQTLESTNPCESMIECVRRSARNVKRWQNGDMCLRWTAAGMLEAQRQFRRSSATATSPPSSSRSSATTTGAVTHEQPLPRPRRTLSSSPADHHAGPLHGFRRRRVILGWLGRGSHVKGRHASAIRDKSLNLVPNCYPASGCVPQSGAVSGGVGELVTWTTLEPSAFAVKIPSVSSMDMPKMISVPSGDQPGSNAR